jgi:hypothetical protein
MVRVATDMSRVQEERWWRRGVDEIRILFAMMLKWRQRPKKVARYSLRDCETARLPVLGQAGI